MRHLARGATPPSPRASPRTASSGHLVMCFVKRPLPNIHRPPNAPRLKQHLDLTPRRHLGLAQGTHCAMPPSRRGASMRFWGTSVRCRSSGYLTNLQSAPFAAAHGYFERINTRLARIPLTARRLRSSLTSYRYPLYSVSMYYQITRTWLTLRCEAFVLSYSSACIAIGNETAA